MLQEIHNTWKTSDTAKRDALILDFLLLPRLLLGRVPNLGHANEKLAKVLFRHLHQQAQPAQQSQPPAKDLRDDMARRIAAAERKVMGGHVGKAVRALLQPGMLDITVDTLDQLQALHPDASAPLSPADIQHAVGEAGKRWLSAKHIGARPDRFYDTGAAPGPFPLDGLVPCFVRFCTTNLAAVDSPPSSL